MVSSGYPPDVDGIGDYTWWLAKALAEELHSDHEMANAYASRSAAVPEVMVLTRVGLDHRPQTGVQVSRFFDPKFPISFEALPETIRRDYWNPGETIDWVVLQYNPFGWGKRGYCPKVPWALKRIRDNPDFPRLAVMFHETTAPPWPVKFAVMCLWQRPIFRHVCRLVEAAFVSTTKWIPQVRQASPSLPIQHLPVGSNIPVHRIPMNEARRSVNVDHDAVVAGVFGAAHVSRLLDWICAAMLRLQQDYPKCILLYVGPDGARVVDACKGVRVVDAGVVDSAQVGAHFCAMDFCLAPFVDGLCSRRTSIVSPAQHGVPVAGCSRPFMDQVFEDFAPELLLRSPAESASQFAEDVSGWARQIVGSRVMDRIRPVDGAALAFAWKSIAGKMIDHLARIPARPGIPENESMSK